MTNNIDKYFKKVEEEDYELIHKYLLKCNYEESNHNFINMMIWIDYYPLFLVHEENFLLLLGIHEGELFLYMPLCESQYFDEAILYAKKICDYNEYPLILSCFTKTQMERVVQLLPDMEGIHVEMSDDYVYEVEKMITLSGKKLQKKRNHYNGFLKEYQDRYTYERIDESNKYECIDFLNNWKKEEDLFFKYDIIGTRRILNDIEKLPCTGGLIRIDGEVKAFAIISELSERMVQENVEKADESIRGLYQAMMIEILKNEAKQYTYVNREDDMGYENIRQAKRAYNPVFMIEKYRVVKKGELV